MLQVCFIPQNTIINEGITSSGQSQHLLQRKLENFRKSVKFLSQTIRIFETVRPIWLIFSRECQDYQPIVNNLQLPGPNILIMALIDGSQHFNILQKSRNFKNLKKKNLYSFLLFQKLRTLFFMISKKISDLKDINFEISTALQFEPSPY